MLFLSLLFFVGFSCVLGNKIVNGAEAKENSAPFFTALYFNNGSHVLFYCGGAIVNSKFVLTAGHCVEWLKPQEVRIVVGSNDLRNGSDFYYPDLFIVHYKIHKPARFHNDIALIRVTEQFKFNDKVKPIKFSDSEIPENSTLSLFGFGRTGTFEPPSVKLLTIDLKHVIAKKCRKLFAEYANVDAATVNLIGSSHLCTLNGKSQGACHGDSGSPLIYDNKVVALVSSLSADGCANGAPDIHTKISFFNTWILANINHNSP